MKGRIQEGDCNASWLHNTHTTHHTPHTTHSKAETGFEYVVKEHGTVKPKAQSEQAPTLPPTFDSVKGWM